MISVSSDSDGKGGARQISWRLLIVAVKLLCVYALSLKDSPFFYQQF